MFPEKRYRVKKGLGTILNILTLTALALILRAHTVSFGLPYFYDEDEAHHFNRTVNMAKSGDMNPHYFHKPSLHFYLRIPVVWLSVYWNKKEGHLDSIKDIRTHNQYGIADYAFTASHPGIVKWNRSFSLLLSLLIVVCTYLTAGVLSGSRMTAFSAGLIAVVSPPLIDYAGTIGVDTLMALNCLISTFFALKHIDKQSKLYLMLSAVFAGLAVSSKYNALPIAAIPLAAGYWSFGFRLIPLLLCATVSALAFFAASPYILISLPEFIEDLSYEVWHYSVAGHEGHSAKPGLNQASFYLSWFANEAIGYCLASLALGGLLLLACKNRKQYWLFLLFPLLYFFMMSLQKANFTRNMLVMIPFLSVMAAVALASITRFSQFNARSRILFFTSLLSISLLQPLGLSLRDLKQRIEKPESRRLLENWILSNNNPEKETAVAGQLQINPQIPMRIPNFTTIDQSRGIRQLMIGGFDRIILRDPDPEEILQIPFIQVIKTVAGNPGEQRVIDNPSLLVADIVRSKIDQSHIQQGIAECTYCDITFSRHPDGYFTCTSDTVEQYCWIKSRFAQLTIPGLSKELESNKQANISLEIMSPWPDNRLSVPGNQETYVRTGPAGAWGRQDLLIEKSMLAGTDVILVEIDKIYSPLKRGLSKDGRRLGIAIKDLELR